MSDYDLPTSGTWVIDPAHTSIEFVARHLMVTKVRGRFTDFSGSIEIADNLTDSKVTIDVDLDSVYTATPERDAHLKSPDFFDVENHPTMKFASTSIVEKGDGYLMTGDLTVKDVTHPLILDVEYLGVMTDPSGKEKAAFSANGEVTRADWGLNWNAPLEAGGVLVSKTAVIEIQAQAARPE